MPAYSGKFQYTGEHGENLNQGPCQVSFDQETCVVTPAGGTLTLKQFGAAFTNMAGELLAAWRDRTVQCMLLEDLEETGRYQGAADGAPGEIRIFKSNLA